ncbi:MAG: cynR 1 [Pseudomonas sp.]|jgi:DNA-binding transcriptional LysR family regulator|uniref:LysR substrate-binding domain-containing protein n=1 Tax=Pseudomonas sp. TaxID=306 RepID=UPI00262FC4EC|nr:LysR substrate-binding domain-containing protein [Pseudomonas sp.]MDB6052048.1 cynR 1 [Pseudomonas sp.]
MKLRQIEAFRAIMMTGSMTLAARTLHTSQPQISRLIGQLEGVAQFPLFERNGSKLKPTLDGERFYQEVEKTFAGLSSLESAAAVIRSFGRDRLMLAAMPRLAGGLLARAVARFKLEYPDVLVTIQSGNESNINEWVRSGLCSTGLAMLYGQTPGILVEPVITTNCVAVFPKGHRFALLEKVTPQDFAGERYISFPNTSPVRNQIDKIFNEAQVNPIIVAEASLGSSICALVGAGMGVSLINPIAAIEEATLNNIESRPFTASIPVVIGLLFPLHHPQSRLVRKFAQCAREVMEEELSPLCD